MSKTTNKLRDEVSKAESLKPMLTKQERSYTSDALNQVKNFLTDNLSKNKTAGTDLEKLIEEEKELILKIQLLAQQKLVEGIKLEIKSADADQVEKQGQKNVLTDEIKQNSWRGFFGMGTEGEKELYEKRREIDKEIKDTQESVKPLRGGYGLFGRLAGDQKIEEDKVNKIIEKLKDHSFSETEEKLKLELKKVREKILKKEQDELKAKIEVLEIEKQKLEEETKKLTTEKENARSAFMGDDQDDKLKKALTAKSAELKKNNLEKEKTVKQIEELNGKVIELKNQFDLANLSLEKNLEEKQEDLLKLFEEKGFIVDREVSPIVVTVKKEFRDKMDDLNNIKDNYLRANSDEGRKTEEDKLGKIVSEKRIDKSTENNPIDRSLDPTTKSVPNDTKIEDKAAVTTSSFSESISGTFSRIPDSFSGIFAGTKLQSTTADDKISNPPANIPKLPDKPGQSR